MLFHDGKSVYFELKSYRFFLKIFFTFCQKVGFNASLSLIDIPSLRSIHIAPPIVISAVMGRVGWYILYSRFSGLTVGDVKKSNMPLPYRKKSFFCTIK
jgi:hypothetical protein